MVLKFKESNLMLFFLQSTADDYTSNSVLYTQKCAQVRAARAEMYESASRTIISSSSYKSYD